MTTMESDLSIAQRIALLPPDQKKEMLDGLDPEELLHQWSFSLGEAEPAATRR